MANRQYNKVKNTNLHGPHKLNIKRLKHIHVGPLGLAFLTSMLKTVLNTNIIPHIWKLANIVRVPKPNKDIDNGILYSRIHILLVSATTLEKSLLPYITANIPNTHATRVQKTTLHSDCTTHIKQHRSKGVQPNGSPCANNHRRTRYEQKFRQNIHTHPNQKAATDQDSMHNQ